MGCTIITLITSEPMSMYKTKSKRANKLRIPTESFCAPTGLCPTFDALHAEKYRLGGLAPCGRWAVTVFAGNLKPLLASMRG